MCLNPIRFVFPAALLLRFILFAFALQRSLGVLAELFGGDSAAPARPAGEASGASSSAPAPVLESGAVGVGHVGGANAASPSVSKSIETYEGGVVLPKPDERQQQQQQQAPPGEGETLLPGAGAAAAGSKAGEAPGGEERFVAHMSTLTDIFKVQDKVSTKKNREEKEKDKGFKVASLFDGLAGAEELQPVAAAAAAAAAAGPDAKTSDFSFAFGSGEAGVAPARTADEDEDEDERAGTVSAEGGHSEQELSLRHSSGPPTESGAAGGLSPNSQPGLTPPSADGAPQGTETALWRSLGDVVAVAARFVRTGKREDVEVAWLGERRALTQDFKRKHKDAVKGRRGAGAGGAASKKRRR